MVQTCLSGDLHLADCHSFVGDRRRLAQYVRPRLRRDQSTAIIDYASLWRRTGRFTLDRSSRSADHVATADPVLLFFADYEYLAGLALHDDRGDGRAPEHSRR